MGNGFGIMHGVPSSYYNFRDTIGKTNILRSKLEYYTRKGDIWGNFEDSLAYLDREMMLGTLDDWLSAFGVLDEEDDDFSAADFFVAQETATSPVFILTQELPKRFSDYFTLTATPTCAFGHHRYALRAAAVYPLRASPESCVPPSGQYA
ncbi:MAG: AbiH family protein [Bacteroides sp.]|nr:AbiH family protein [Syntrophomonadaceae bacterium]MDD4720760.1 AbiH family protein [Bacteroides sp.]